jgi:hypothetical protein
VRIRNRENAAQQTNKPKERNTSMIAKKHVMLIALGACLVGLSLSGFGSQKNPVERPHKGVGQFHAVINLVTSSFVATGVGHSTHGGQFRSYLEGLVTFGPNGPAPSSGSGIITVANGDQLFVEVAPDGSTVVTGGTGRFEGATGSQTATNVGDPVVTYDSATGTLTIDATQMIEGTLTY